MNLNLTYSLKTLRGSRLILKKYLKVLVELILDGEWGNGKESYEFLVWQNFKELIPVSQRMFNTNRKKV